MPVRKVEAETQSFPGVRHAMLVDKALGSGAVTLGRVTIDPGARIPPHTHPVEDAMIILEGVGELTVDGHVEALVPGTACLAPANSVHSVRNTGKQPLVLIFTWPAVDVARKLVPEADNARSKAAHAGQSAGR